MIKQTRKLLGESNGNILLITMLIIFAVSIIGTMLASMSSTDLKISANQRTHVQALSTTEAGLTEVIHRMALPDPTVVTVGTWTGNIAIYDTEPFDPNWTTNVFLASPGSVPANAGSVFNTGTVQDPNQAYLAYSQPSGTEGVITIQHKWVDRNNDNVRDANEIVRYDPSIVPSENFMSGFPVDVITLRGRSGNATRIVQAEVTKKMLTVKTLGAVYGNDEIRARDVYGFCGYNHDITMPSWLMPQACFPYHVGWGNLPAVTTTGGDIRLEDNGEVVGVPGPTDSDPTNPWWSLAEVLGLTDAELADLLANADHTTMTTPLDGITYINGDVTVSSPIVGSGLLYITGRVEIESTFEFRGLVYLEGELHDSEDNTWVLGGLIVKDRLHDFRDETGPSAVLYSQDAIRMNLSRYLPVETISWREL